MMWKRRKDREEDKEREGEHVGRCKKVMEKGWSGKKGRIMVVQMTANPKLHQIKIDICCMVRGLNAKT